MIERHAMPVDQDRNIDDRILQERIVQDRDGRDRWVRQETGETPARLASRRPARWTNILLLACIAVACSQSSSEPEAPAASPPADSIAAGWVAFEGGDYTAALAAFVDALGQDATLVEAQWGRGWSLARLQRYDEAHTAFTTAISLDATAPDAQAGLALAAAATGAQAAAVTAASTLLDLAPQYVFVHDTSVGATELRLLRAQQNYRLGDYAAAAADLDLLAPGGAPHSVDPLALLAALAGLGGAIDP